MIDPTEKQILEKKIFDLQLEKKIADLQMGKQISDLKAQLLEDHIKKIENIVTAKNSDVEFIKNMAAKAGNVAEKSVDAVNKTADFAKQSMKALTFLQTYYNNAPALEAPKKWLADLKLLEKIEITDSDDEYYDEEYYKVEKRNEQIKSTDNTNEDNFVKELNTNKQKLNEKIGDIILASIKKENPKVQSLWCSDVSRLSYLVRDIVDNSKKISEWKIDKNGKKMCELLIIPLVNEIKAISKEFLYRSYLKIHNGTGDSECHMNMNVEITELLDLLCSKTLTAQIKKYVASALYLDKTDGNNPET